MRPVALGMLAAVVASLAASSVRAADPVPPLPSRTVLDSRRATFDRLAVTGWKETNKIWWNASKGWYAGRSNMDPPVASLWSVLPFLELSAAVAIRHPTLANKAFVNGLFLKAENYWDPTLGKNGSGGVSWLWGLRNTGNAYFDDAGWWGAAYLDAYRATGKERWLWDAGRALSWIDAFGWNRPSGGTWWDTDHRHLTAEPLAAGALIAATLYRIEHRAYYLRIAKRYIGWADAKTVSAAQENLYGRSDTDSTVMDYVQGMMIGADLELCRALKQQSWCKRAEALARGSIHQFPVLADWSPETDVIYLRWLLELYDVDRNPTWYAVVYANGARAQAHAREVDGMWARRWDGGYAQPGTIYTQSATLELFAWLATASPPSR